jgi:hypothetical protein
LWLVQSEEFVYPACETPLVEAYGGLFESVFVVLHPFVHVPESLSWSVTRAYPGDAQIAALGSKCTWSEVAAQVKLNSCAQMNQALLTLIGSLVDPMADPAGCERLQSFLESEPVWMPAGDVSSRFYNATFFRYSKLPEPRNLSLSPNFRFPTPPCVCP